MGDRDELPSHWQDLLRQAEELFGPETAEDMRGQMRKAKPGLADVDPVTGQRSYSHEDD